jgi:hypothetical protein
VKITLTLSRDSGSEISSLHVPVPQSDYLQLSDEQLVAEYLTPYLHQLRLDAALMLGCLESGVLKAHLGDYGPA